MFNAQYYAEKKQKLQIREQKNIRRYIQSAFDFVAEQQDIKERWDEILAREAEAKKKAEKKIEKKSEKKKSK